MDLEEEMGMNSSLLLREHATERAPAGPFSHSKVERKYWYSCQIYTRLWSWSCLLVLGEVEECQLLWQPPRLLPGQLPCSGDLTQRRAFGTVHRWAFCAACCVICHDFWPVQPPWHFSSCSRGSWAERQYSEAGRDDAMHPSCEILLRKAAMHK